MAIQEINSDKLFEISFGTGSGVRSIHSVLTINKATENSHTNDFAGAGSIIINSDRVIVNAKADHAFLCGKEGVTVTSPKSIHIDCTDDLYLASQQEIYLGLPARGNKWDQVPEPKTKASATKNRPYEPVVLGLKLANLLEDLIVIIRDSVIRTPAGDGHMSVEMMYNLECLHSRIPEILSTAVFVDGISHGSVDKPEPTAPDTTLIEVTTDQTAGTAGSTVSGNAQSATGTTQQNTQTAIDPQVLAAAAPNLASLLNSINPDGAVR